MERSNLQKIKLSNYQKVVKQKDNEDEGLILALLLGVTMDTIRNLKQKDLAQLAEEVREGFEAEPQFIDRFTLDGIEYGFIPKLDDITYGENKDLSSYISNWETMHNAMAVAYRPIKQRLGNKYLIEDYEGSSKYADIMKSAPLNVVLGMQVFFYNLTKELLKAIPNYLEREVEGRPQISQENGEVIKKYIHSLKETLKDLNQ